jgi:hypothetical protein
MSFTIAPSMSPLTLDISLDRGVSDLQGAVIIAVATVGMMQVITNQIVKMVSMWRLLVTAP